MAQQPRYERVQRTLSACKIAQLGSTKLPIIGQGNTHKREDGTTVRIFNVQGFASKEDAQEAGRLWAAGARLEKAGKTAEAEEQYRQAYNKMMSFSVLEEQGARFANAMEVMGVIEEVPTREGGTKLGLNRVRPVVVEATGTSAASFFELPKDALEGEEDFTSEEEIKAQPEAKATKKAAAPTGGNQRRTLSGPKTK